MRPVGLFFAVVAVENCIIVVLKKGHEALSFKSAALKRLMRAFFLGGGQHQESSGCAVRDEVFLFVSL